MKFFDNIRNFLKDESHYLCLYNDNVYIGNYLSLPHFNDNEIKVTLRDLSYLIQGTELKIRKMTKDELLITGNITDIKVLK